MKSITISLNRKILTGDLLGGDLLAHCACELDINPADKAATWAQIKEAAGMCAAAIDEQLRIQSERHPKPSREPGCDDDVSDDRDDRDEGDRGYRGAPATDYDNRRDNQAPPRRDDRERYREDGGGRRDDRGGRRDDRGGRHTNSDQPPKTGKQLFGWAKDHDVMPWFSDFGKEHRFPARFNDWDERDVDDAMREYYRSTTAARNGNGRH